MNIIGSEFWVNSENLSFKDILITSRLPRHWAMQNQIENKYSNDFLKPVNRYVSNLYPKPELISIEGNIVVFRQHTHAEIWVEPQREGLYALDKTWQRQFYPSEISFDNSECFDATYKFYMPWVPDFLGKANILTVSNSETFIVKDMLISCNPINIQLEYAEPPFIPFKIKRYGQHMKTDEYGIIDIGTAMYDIVVRLTDLEVENVRRQFGQ
jgi:hypothetical protein